MSSGPSQRCLSKTVDTLQIKTSVFVVKTHFTYVRTKENHVSLEFELPDDRVSHLFWEIFIWRQARGVEPSFLALLEKPKLEEQRPCLGHVLDQI